MNHDENPEGSETGTPDSELTQTRKELSRLKEEVERLRRRASDERFAEELRDALSLASAAGTIGSPVTHGRLLEMIVETAAHVIGARAAALFLVDEPARELIFEVALGQKAAEVKKFRVPLGHGIAGLVAVSGQPMAIADASSDPRLAADIAHSVGYVPRSILCVPLYYGDSIIGVLELLDKENPLDDNPTSFDAFDMDALGLFAHQAAVAIEQSRTHNNLAALVGEVLASYATIGDAKRQNLAARAVDFAGNVENDAAYTRALELARLVQSIAGQGEAEYETCRTLLRGFASYLATHQGVGATS